MRIVVEQSTTQTRNGMERLAALDMIAQSLGNDNLSIDIRSFLKKRKNEPAVFEFTAESSSVTYIPRGLFYRNIPRIQDVIFVADGPTNGPVITNNIITMLQEDGTRNVFEVPKFTKNKQPTLEELITVITDNVMKKILEQKKIPEKKEVDENKIRIYAKL